MHLSRTDELDAEVDALAARHGGRVGVDAVLSDLDQRLRRTWAPGRAVRRAWTWDWADRGDRRWWPQGVSVAPGARHVAVSWYAKDGGSRVSFLDLDARRYRHVQLVAPTADAFEPLRVHAGGLAWHGSLLYVAATKAGLWVCDTDDVVRDAAEYLLPVRYRLSLASDDGVEPFRFSFVAVDSAGSPPRLVMGEYDNGGLTRRLAHVGIDGGAMSLTEGCVVRAQGAVLVADRWYVTSSHGPWKRGSLWNGSGGALREYPRALPMGPEDLAHDPESDLLWTVTEHPHRRWLVALSRSSVE